MGSQFWRSRMRSASWGQIEEENMELTEQEGSLVRDLINIAWQSGAVKSPQVGMMLEQLRTKLQQKTVGSTKSNGHELLPAVASDKLQ
jgi:hypothetical protein